MKTMTHFAIASLLFAASACTETKKPSRPAGSCASGTHWDATQNSCVADTPSGNPGGNQQQTCYGNEEWSFAEGRCVAKVQDCTGDTHWDATQQTCVANAPSGAASCDAATQQWDETLQQCVAKVATGPSTCLETEQWDEAQSKCVPKTPAVDPNPNPDPNTNPNTNPGGGLITDMPPTTTDPNAGGGNVQPSANERKIVPAKSTFLVDPAGTSNCFSQDLTIPQDGLVVELMDTTRVVSPNQIAVKIKTTLEGCPMTEAFLFKAHWTWTPALPQ